MLHTFHFPGNWTLEVNPETDFFDLYFSHPETGERALYSIQPGERRHDSLPEWQPLVHEVPKEDGTIGYICPLVTKVNGKWKVAVMRNERHVGKRVETARKAWDNPSDMPQLPSGVEVKRHDLGRGDSNTARIVGGDGIRMEIVVISGFEKIPELPGKSFWMKFETFAERHRDDMGNAAIGKAFMLGLLK